MISQASDNPTGMVLLPSSFHDLLHIAYYNMTRELLQNWCPRPWNQDYEHLPGVFDELCYTLHFCTGPCTCILSIQVTAKGWQQRGSAQDHKMFPKQEILLGTNAAHVT